MTEVLGVATDGVAVRLEVGVQGVLAAESQRVPMITRVMMMMRLAAAPWAVAAVWGPVSLEGALWAVAEERE